MTDRNSISISVLTATYNAEALLPALIESLLAQSDRDFTWLVADGGSTDGTMALIEQARARGLKVSVDSSPDFGIYDALNRGLRRCNTDYYLVTGADDVLFPEAIKTYRDAAAASVTVPDIVTARVKVGQGSIFVRPGMAWLHGNMGYVSAHAVGSLFRRDLHDRYGYYSRKFPIGADMLFVKTVGRAGVRIEAIDVMVGEFGEGGVSSVDLVGTLSEFFRIQLLTEDNKWLQVLIYIIRLFKNFKGL